MARVVVAMSGGVDSSVAALLLRERGHDVVGLFLRNGAHAAPRSRGDAHRQGCCSIEDARDARAVAAALGVPFYALDFSAEFGALIDRFVGEYRRGRTPNPCALCNRDLKLGALLSFARSIGAEAVATGHYARAERRDGRMRLRRGVDRAKDQSYVLAPVEPAALERAIFPIGELAKPEVREHARRAGLPVAEKRESQEICFVPTNDYRDLLRERGVAGTPGRIVDREGGVLGEHAGFEGFTVGQRRGIGVAAPAPLYVTSIDPQTATVVVGERPDLLRSWIECDSVGWLGADPPSPGERRACEVQIRAHHVAVPATVAAAGAGVRIEVAAPLDAAAPGQLAVLYEGDVVAGSAWIDRAGR
ncbi:MAG TPA: tRNA 2-thiouridine(34) synthase MnmA [Planctomycetota bacterium]|nr:tRNA 2-thiouridine(34) synthase MnmA [Planctomycetota bacterium]